MATINATAKENEVIISDDAKRLLDVLVELGKLEVLFDFIKTLYCEKNTVHASNDEENAEQ